MACLSCMTESHISTGSTSPRPTRTNGKLKNTHTHTHTRACHALAGSRQGLGSWPQGRRDMQFHRRVVVSLVCHSLKLQCVFKIHSHTPDKNKAQKHTAMTCLGRVAGPYVCQQVSRVCDCLWPLWPPIFREGASAVVPAVPAVPSPPSRRSGAPANDAGSGGFGRRRTGAQASREGPHEGVRGGERRNGSR